MTVATLSGKFQVSIPKEVRDALGLKAGQKIVFITTGTSVKLLAQPSMADVVGIARGASTADVRDRTERELPARRALPTTGKSTRKSMGKAIGKSALETASKGAVLRRS